MKAFVLVASGCMVSGFVPAPAPRNACFKNDGLFMFNSYIDELSSASRSAVKTSHATVVAPPPMPPVGATLETEFFEKEEKLIGGPDMEKTVDQAITDRIEEAAHVDLQELKDFIEEAGSGLSAPFPPNALNVEEYTEPSDETVEAELDLEAADLTISETNELQDLVEGLDSGLTPSHPQDSLHVEDLTNLGDETVEEAELDLDPVESVINAALMDTEKNNLEDLVEEVESASSEPSPQDIIELDEVTKASDETVEVELDLDVAQLVTNDVFTEDEAEVLQNLVDELSSSSQSTQDTVYQGDVTKQRRDEANEAELIMDLAHSVTNAALAGSKTAVCGLMALLEAASSAAKSSAQAETVTKDSEIEEFPQFRSAKELQQFLNNPEEVRRAMKVSQKKLAKVKGLVSATAMEILQSREAEEAWKNAEEAGRSARDIYETSTLLARQSREKVTNILSEQEKSSTALKTLKSLVLEKKKVSFIPTAKIPEVSSAMVQEILKSKEEFLAAIKKTDSWERVNDLLRFQSQPKSLPSASKEINLSVGPVTGLFGYQPQPNAMIHAETKKEKDTSGHVKELFRYHSPSEGRATVTKPDVSSGPVNGLFGYQPQPKSE